MKDGFNKVYKLIFFIIFFQLCNKIIACLLIRNLNEKICQLIICIVWNTTEFN